MLISNLVKPKFDKHLNKFQTWKWQTKPGSFLVTPKWRFCDVFESLKFNTQNHLSLHMSYKLAPKGVNTPFLKQVFLSIMSKTAKSIWVVSIWQSKNMCTGFPIFYFIFIIFYAHFKLGQTKVWQTFKQTTLFAVFVFVYTCKLLFVYIWNKNTCVFIYIKNVYVFKLKTENRATPLETEQGARANRSIWPSGQTDPWVSEVSGRHISVPSELFIRCGVVP